MFVAGATGYTGREVVRECVERGLDTVAHVRPDSARLDHWRAHFEDLGARVDTTEWKLAAFKASFEALQPKTVYALLGTTKARGKRGERSAVPDTYEAVDYGLTTLLLEAAVACGSRPRFVYLSAIGAEGRPLNAYMDVRKRVEAAIVGSELPHVLARPAFVSGGDREEARPTERAAAVVGDALLGIVGKLGGKGLATKYRSMTGAEVAKALVHIAGRDAETIVAETEELLRALEA
ncbi:hypothetical protein PPSIR1_29955 [Plesiocystis pacifica SIR-1]|uniref:NAD(P)-binding domain-containing protein n=1 Tax=Plesiocystis pacifica SIR-1 TaxID=391625 RepID=A6FYX0_9BACT|nr:hypothetical protein PPSIR1_29955 [Plesiocystis pacifica SIR-1]